jgi:hypothetical protein
MSVMVKSCVYYQAGTKFDLKVFNDYWFLQSKNYVGHFPLSLYIFIFKITFRRLKPVPVLILKPALLGPVDRTIFPSEIVTSSVDWA